MAGYDTVYLGFPIWGETAPPPICSFLRTHDFTGRTLVPFITHGGYGLGNSRTVLANHAPGTRIGTAFSMQADQERRTMEQVNAGWTSYRSGAPQRPVERPSVMDRPRHAAHTSLWSD